MDKNTTSREQSKDVPPVGKQAVYSIFAENSN